MQTVSDWGEDLQTDQPVEAIDVRDGNTYTVSKLKDGKIWMTSNLRIAGQTLNSETSDLESGTLEIPESDINSFKLSGWEEEDTKAVYIDETNGGYYNRELVIANNRNKSNSICPKGWRPPTKSDFDSLISAYGNNALSLISAPANFGLNGNVAIDIHCVDPGELNSVRSSGVYWSSTADNNQSGLYTLNLTKSTLTFNIRWYAKNRCNACRQNHLGGGNLRCVARTPNEQLEDNRVPGTFTDCSTCIPRSSCVSPVYYD